MTIRDGSIQIKRLRTVDALRDRLAELGLELPVDDALECGSDSPLGQPFTINDGSGALAVGNRFCVLPMEGWDGTSDGSATELVRRRWRRFGQSGAKLVWGGEAVAVLPDGRANPRQLVIGEHTVEGLASLRRELVDAHVEAVGDAEGLVVGLQLTHSGRWSRPSGGFEPRVAYRHPLLDERVGADDSAVLTDEDLDTMIEAFVVAAVRSADAGFDFVDLKHCHGYLLHELLSGTDRSGRFGGSFENRTRFLREVVSGIRDRAPKLAIGVRLSAYDMIPHIAGSDGRGRAQIEGPYAHAFGGDGTGTGVDLDETHRFLDLCTELGIGTVCITAGSPYYVPHIQRPAFFPPSDGYQPPQDPLVEVARMVSVTAVLAEAHPAVAIVGTGYSYLQDWAAHVGQSIVRSGGAASIGLGRMMLSYPDFPRDVLAGAPLRRELVCRTFSDCTTAPRNGLVSGCYPLDEQYKSMPERVELAAVKRRQRGDRSRRA